MTKIIIIVLTVATLILSNQVVAFAQGRPPQNPIEQLQNQINDLQQQINSIWNPRVLHGLVSAAGTRQSGAGDWSVSTFDDPARAWYTVVLQGFLASGSKPTCIAVAPFHGGDSYYFKLESPYNPMYGLWRFDAQSGHKKYGSDPAEYEPYHQEFQFVCIQE